MPIANDPSAGPQYQLRNPFTGDYQTFEPDEFRRLQYGEEPAPEQPAPEPDPVEEGVGLADYAKSIMAGGAGIVQGAGWMARQLGSEDIGGAIENLGSQAVDYWNDALSDSAKRALAEDFVTKNEFGEYEFGDTSELIHKVGLMGAQSLLGTGAGFGAGVGVSKVLQMFANPVGRAALSRAAAPAVEASRRGATLAPEVARTAVPALKKLRLVDTVIGAAGFGAGEGLVGGTQGGVNVYESIMRLPPEQLLKNPRYQQVYESTDDTLPELERHQYAAETIAREASSLAGLQSGLTTALLGAPMGAFFGRVLGKTGRLGSSRLRAAGFGAAGEAAQEFAQSGAEAGIAGRQRRIAGEENVQILDEMINEAIGGALAGGMLGGAVGAGTFQADAGQQSAQQGKQRRSPQELRKNAVLEGARRAAAAGVPAEEAFEVARQFDAGEIDALRATRRFRELEEAAAAEGAGEQAKAATGAAGPAQPGEAGPGTDAAAEAPERPAVQPMRPEPAETESSSTETPREPRRATFGRTDPEAGPEPARPAAPESGGAQERIETALADQPSSIATAARRATEAGVEPETVIQTAQAAEGSVFDRIQALRDLERAPRVRTSVDEAAHEAATSPLNETAEPTPAQREAGNYPKGHVRVAGLDLSIENPAGSTRTGTDDTGRVWATELQSHYGYVRGAEGADGDPVDVFVKPGLDAESAPERVFVVDQVRGEGETQQFDESKVLVGPETTDEAVDMYLANYDERGPDLIGAVTPVATSELKGWLGSGETGQAFSASSIGQQARARAEREGETVIQRVAPERLVRAPDAELREYAQGVVDNNVRRVTLVGSTLERGAGAADVDVLYEFDADLPANRAEAEDAVQGIIERSQIDTERFDTFVQVGDRYFHVSSGAGRGVVENTEYAREQQDRPRQVLAERGEAELVESDEPLAERTRADIAGEPPNRARLIALRNFLDEATEMSADDVVAPSGASDLLVRIERGLESGQDTRAIERDAYANIREWLQSGVDEGLAVELRGFEQGFRNALDAPAEPERLPGGQTPEQAAALRELATQAGWSERGGQIIRDPRTEKVVGRTQWLPRADWWPGRPGGFNERQTSEIVEKGLNGQRLGRRQQEYFDFLTEMADEMVAGGAYAPQPADLAEGELESSPDTDFEVSLVARAAEINEDAVERAAQQYEDDNAGFLRAVKSIVDEAGQQATATLKSRPRRPQTQERDLLGDDTRQRQALADEQRRRDQARSPNQDVPLETGDPSDLFSEARQQTDIEDEPGALYQRAFHGSPHRFDRFSTEAIGTGEGAAAFGHGLYFAESSETAESYQASVRDIEALQRLERERVAAANRQDMLERQLARASEPTERARLERELAQATSEREAAQAEYERARDGGGNLYEVDIDDAAVARMLDRERPINEQPRSVQDGVTRAFQQIDLPPRLNMPGKQAYERLSAALSRRNGIPRYASERLASEALRDAGVPGMTYFDQLSRGAGEGTRNLVVFDDNLVTITAVNGEPVSAAQSDELVEEMRAEQGEPMRSRRRLDSEAGSQVPRGAQARALHERFAERIENLRPLVDFQIVQSVADLPDPNAPSDVEGAYFQDGRVYLVADNLPTAERAEEVFRHEVFGHLAMERVPEFKRVLDQVKNAARMGNRQINELRREVHQRQPWLTPDTEAREVLALMAERGAKSNALERAKGALRSWAEQAGIEVPTDEASLRRLLTLAGRNLERDARITRDFAAAAEQHPEVARLQNEPEPSDETITAALERLYGDRAELDTAMRERAGESLRSRQATLEPEIQRMQDTLMAPAPEAVSLPDRIRRWVKERLQFDMDEIAQGLTDDLHSIEKLEVNTFGGLLDASESPTKMARLTRNLPSVMTGVMFHGVPEYTGGTFQLKSGRKGFMEIFEPAVSHSDGNLLQPTLLYMVAKRAKALKESRGIDAFKGRMSDADIDAALAQAEKYPFMEQVAQDWETFNNQLLDLGAQQGVLDPEMVERWKENFYVPFHRLLEGETESGPHAGGTRLEGRGAQRAKQRLVGSEAPLGDVFANMMNNTAYLLDEIYKNTAMQRIAEMGEGVVLKKVPSAWRPARVSNAEMAKALRESGMVVGEAREDAFGTTVLDQLPKDVRDSWSQVFERTAPAGPNIVRVFRDGKPVYYEVTDPLVLRSITTLNHQNVVDIFGLLTGSKRLLTSMITADPAFMLRNWIRDTLSTWVVADAPGLKPMVDGARGFSAALKESPEVWNVMMAGGGGGTYYDQQPQDIRKFLIDRVGSVSKAQAFEKTIANPRNLVRMWRRVGNAAENANRVAVYRRVREAGGSQAEAAYQAMDVLNFSRRGDWTAMRHLTAYVPFLNARVQGMSRLARGFKDNPGQFMFRGGMLLAATLGLMLRNTDREEYEELPEWDRDMYYHLFLNERGTPVGDGDHWRIPKPFEVGLLFGTMPERMIRAATGRDSHRIATETMKRAIGETLAFNPIPQLVKPAVEQWANKSFFFGSPIVGFAEQGRIPEEQATPWTSETLREIADALPDWAPDWTRSPERLEHLVRAYLGATGMYMLSVSDAATRATFSYPQQPSRKIYDMPVVSAVLRDPEPRYTKYSDQLYTMLDEANAAFRTINEMREQGRMEDAQELFERSRNKLATRKRLNQVASRVRKINGEIERTMAAPMAAGAKRKRLDELYRQKNEVLRHVGQVADLY